jgi:hypothetical protein
MRPARWFANTEHFKAIFAGSEHMKTGAAKAAPFFIVPINRNIERALDLNIYG